MDKKNIFFDTSGSMKWDTSSSEIFEIPLIACAEDRDVLNLTIHSSKASMLFVDVLLTKRDSGGTQICESSAPIPARQLNEIHGVSKQAQGYQTSFVVEWTGSNTLHLLLHSFNAVGNPEKLESMDLLVLTARGYTFPDTILNVIDATLSAEIPLIRVNSGEYLLEDFTSPRFWDERKWYRLDRKNFAGSEAGLYKDWFYMTMWNVIKQGGHSGAAYARDFNTDITEFQSLIVSVSVDSRCLFSVEIVIDGTRKLVLDQEAGKGEGKEYRIPICGSVLQSVVFIIEDKGTAGVLEDGLKVTSTFRWLMLERAGTDPKNANEVYGMDSIPDPEHIESFYGAGLPVGLLFGHKELSMIKEARKKGNRVNAQKKLVAEILAEADSQSGFPFETYAGTYLPVGWGNQGVERASAPAEAMPHFYNAMVIGGLAYLLTGEIKYAVTARRAMLTTVRCRHWVAGFVTRIPVGLPGYRATFIESHASEAVALCYDFIYNVLSPEERREVEDALYDKAVRWIDSYLRSNKDHLLRSNQGAVYTAGFMFSALIARRSHPDVDGMIERNLLWFYSMLDNYYKPDGSTTEGPSYWLYTTQYAALSMILASRYLQKPLVELAPAHFRNTIDYMCHMRSLSRKELNFLCISDCNYMGDYCTQIGPAILFFSKYFGVEEAAWLWENFCDFTDDPQRSFIQPLSVIGAVTGALMTLLMWEDRETKALAQLPARKIFSYSKRIFLRTGQKYGDLLLFFEGGSKTIEHSHFDKGQFIIEAYGETLAADPGMISYNRPSHPLYQNSSYHNIVTVAGRNQSYKDAGKAVVIREFSYNEEQGYDYIAVDLSNSYKELKVYNRRILFIRPYYFLLVDEIESVEDGIEWNFHSKGTFNLADAPDRVRVCAANACMDMSFLSSAELNCNSGVYMDEEKVVCNNLVLYPDKAARQLNIAALLLPYPASRKEAEKTGGGKDPSDLLSQCRVESVREEDSFTFHVYGHWGCDQVTYHSMEYIEVSRKQNNEVGTCFTIQCSNAEK
ncbi:MAG: alginate lyase family protein [Ruminiclostridium sp.]|nr:alginate lyase family protein [Ruminiclostridium sp.]